MHGITKTENPLYDAAHERTFNVDFISFNFNKFFTEVQTIIDSGDPINHMCECAQLRPVHLIKVNGDQVVPNSATDRLITAGNLKKLGTVGPNAVGPGSERLRGVYQGRSRPAVQPRGKPGRDRRDAAAVGAVGRLGSAAWRSVRGDHRPGGDRTVTATVLQD